MSDKLSEVDKICNIISMAIRRVKQIDSNIAFNAARLLEAAADSIRSAEVHGRADAFDEVRARGNVERTGA